MEINSNHSNLAFDREIDKTKDWLETKVTDACGHPSEALLNCIMQRLTDTFLGPYAALCKSVGRTGDQIPQVPGYILKSQGANLALGTGKVSITPSQWLVNQYRFLLHWAFCYLSLFWTARRPSKSAPATLVFDIGEESLFQNGNDEQFVRYCRSGQIEPLRTGKRIVIQYSAKNTHSTDPSFTYNRSPLTYVIREAKLGMFERIRLELGHWHLLFSYIAATIQLPLLSLLSKDLAYTSTFSALQRRGLIETIILTTGSYVQQPLWVRRFPLSKIHMVWYSQSAQLITYAADNISSYIPNYRWICAGVHWVWTNAFAQYIRAFTGNAEIKVVGPIVWYTPQITSPPTNEIRIAIFDVPPFSHEYSLSALGVFPNYYIPENLLKFVSGIASIKRDLELEFHSSVSLQLKVKREDKFWSNAAYNSYLKELEASGVLTLVPYSMNLYSLISGCHLVIAYPFSSPAYIAESLGVPSIYYDPMGTIARHDFGDSQSLINFANCPDDLLKAAITALSSDLSDAATVKERVAVSS